MGDILQKSVAITLKKKWNNFETSLLHPSGRTKADRPSAVFVYTDGHSLTGESIKDTDYVDWKRWTHQGRKLFQTTCTICAYIGESTYRILYHSYDDDDLPTHHEKEEESCRPVQCNTGSDQPSVTASIHFQ